MQIFSDSGFRLTGSLISLSITPQEYFSLPENLFIWPRSMECLLCSRHCTKIFPRPEEGKFLAKGLWLCGITRNRKECVLTHSLTQRKVQLWLLSFTLGWSANWRPSSVTLRHYLHFSVSLGTVSFSIQEWCFIRNEDFDHFRNDKVLPNLPLRITLSRDAWLSLQSGQGVNT